MKSMFQNFIDKVKKILKEDYGDKIHAAVLFGSFAKGNPKQGSDLDIVIQLKPGVSKYELSGIRKEIERLDKKYGIGSSWVFYDPILRLVHPIILEHDEINWEEGSIKDFIVHWIISLGISEALFFKRLKKSGKVLYGEDVLENIKVSPGFVDNFIDIFTTPLYKLWKVSAKFLYRVFWRRLS